MIPVQTEVVNQFLRNQVDLERYSESVRGKVVGILEKAQKEIVAALVDNDPTIKPATEWKRKRLAQLNDQISEILGTKFGEIDKVVTKDLSALATFQNDATQAQVKRAFGANLFNVTLTQAKLEAIVGNTMIEGAVIGKWWSQKPEVYRQKIEKAMNAGMQEIELGLVKGEAIGDLIRRVRGSKNTPGVMDLAKHDAAALVRTSVMQVAQTVRRDIYDANADVLKGLQVVATLDSRTTPLCRGLDGQMYNMDGSPMNGGRPMPPGPPFHWNCRSTLIPVFKPYSEMKKAGGSLSAEKMDALNKMDAGTRASMNGQVPDVLNYNQWLKTQPEAFQKDILGESRWELWKTDKLTMADMVHQNGRPLSINELEQKVALYDEKKALELQVKELLAKIEDPAQAAVFKPGEPIPGELFKPIKSAQDLKYEYPELGLDPVKGKAGKKISSGVITFEPETGKVWIFEPKDHFKGYEHSFPKGTAKLGQSLEGNAIREMWEETGLQSKILGHLGDYEKTESVTRYYIGIRTGGSPAMAGWESQGVKLVPQGQLNKYLNVAVDQGIADDFAKAYQAALEAGSGDAIAGFEYAASESLYSKKITALLSDNTDLAGKALPKLKDVPGLTTMPKKQLFGLYEQSMNAQAAADINAWLLDPGLKDVIKGTPGKTSSIEYWAKAEKAVKQYYELAEDSIASAPEGSALWSAKKLAKMDAGYDELSSAEKIAKTKQLAKSLNIQADAEIFAIAENEYTIDKHLLQWAESEEGGTWVDNHQKLGFIRKQKAQAWKEIDEILKKETPGWSKMSPHKQAQLRKGMMDDYVEHLSQLEATETLAVEDWHALNQDVQAMMFEDNLGAFGDMATDIEMELDKASEFNGMSWGQKVTYLEEHGPAIDAQLKEYDALLQKPGAASALETIMAENPGFPDYPVSDKLTELKVKLDAAKISAAQGAVDAGLKGQIVVDMAGGGPTAIKLGSQTFDLADPAQLKAFKQKQNSAIQSYKAAVVQGKKPSQTMLDAVGSLSPEKKSTLESQIKAKMGGKMPTAPELHVAAEETAGGAMSTAEKVAMDTLQEAASLHPDEYNKWIGGLKQGTPEWKSYVEGTMQDNVKQFRSELQKKYDDLIKGNPEEWKAWKKTADLKAPVEYQYSELKKAIEKDLTSPAKKAAAAAAEEFESLKMANQSKFFDYTETYPSLDDYAGTPIAEKIAGFKSYLQGIEAATTAATEAAAVATEIPLTGTVKLGGMSYDLSDLNQLKVFKQKQNSAIQSYKQVILAGKQPSTLQQQAVDLLSADKKELLKLQIEKKGGQMKQAETLATEVKPVTSESIEYKDYVKYANKKGSNTGGFFQNRKNPADRWYIKTPANEEIARNEILAGKLYRAAGVEVPELRYTVVDGKTSVASRIIDGVAEDSGALTSGAMRAGVQENFVVDAWLGDWDVVGATYDNLMIKDGARAVRIDVGGSLRFRAQGLAKGEAFGNEVTELKSMRNAMDNSQAASVFKDITKEEMLAGARKVLSVSDDEIRRLVDAHGPIDKVERKKLADTLIARKKYIAKEFPEIKVSTPAPKPKEASSVITDFEQKQIKASRANGYSINLDKEDIEDHNVLFWQERAKGQKQHTLASFKVRDKAMARLDKMIGGAADAGEFFSTDDLYNSTLNTIKGIKKQFTGVADGQLRELDISRAKEAWTKYKAAEAEIKSLVKMGRLGQNDLKRFTAHYGDWLETLHQISIQKTGTKYTPFKKWMDVQLKPLPSMAHKVKTVAAAGPEIKFRQIKDAIIEKKIEKGHLIQTDTKLSLGKAEVHVAYEADIDGVRVRYWGKTPLFADKGKVEFMVDGDGAAATEKVINAMKKLGIDTTRSAVDDELLYLKQILYHMNDSGYTALEHEIRDMAAGDAVKKLQGLVSKKIGKDVTKIKEYAPLGERNAFGQGKVIRMRPDLAVDKSFQDFRQKYSLYHSLYQDIPSAIDAILESGGNMISTTNKLRVGKQWGGWSPGSDMGTGGASYLFTRIQPIVEASGHTGLQWDTNLLRRLDSISYNGDKYGRVTGDTVRTHRKTGVSEWIDTARHGSNETIFKDTLSILDPNFKRVTCRNEAERRATIAVFKKHGYKTMPDGRSLESVIVSMK